MTVKEFAAAAKRTEVSIYAYEAQADRGTMYDSTYGRIALALKMSPEDFTKAWQSTPVALPEPDADPSEAKRKSTAEWIERFLRLKDGDRMESLMDVDAATLRNLAAFLQGVAKEKQRKMDAEIRRQPRKTAAMAQAKPDRKMKEAKEAG